MSDFGDNDDGGYGDEWMYVEDYWDEANDLAEYTCPSPVPLEDTSVNNDDYDVFDYWQDVEYISDGGYYEDHKSPARKRKLAQSLSKTPNRSKRRRGPVLEGDRQPSLGIPPVSWISQRDRNHALQPAIHLSPSSSSKETARTVALLENWRESFKDSTGLVSASKSGSDHVQGDGFDLSDLQSVAGLLTEENMGALSEMLEAKGLDPEALQMVIQDLLTGKERSFGSDSEGGEEEGAIAADQNDGQGYSVDEESLPGDGGNDPALGHWHSYHQGTGGQAAFDSHTLSLDPASEAPSREVRSKRKLRSDANSPDDESHRGRKLRKRL